MEWLNNFLLSLFQNPMWYIGLVFAFVAAFGFLIFLRGFLNGIEHLFTIDTKAEYVKLARTRMVWGVLIMLTLLIWWEILKWFAAFFA